MKYKKRTNNIDMDYAYYIGVEGLFNVAFFGHKGNKRKCNYIWNQLLKQHNTKQNTLNK
jgi:hypothetical protein